MAYSHAMHYKPILLESHRIHWPAQNAEKLVHRPETNHVVYLTGYFVKKVVSKLSSRVSGKKFAGNSNDSDMTT